MTPLVAGAAGAVAVVVVALAVGPTPAGRPRPLPATAVARSPRGGCPAWVAEGCRQLGGAIAPGHAWTVLRCAAAGAALVAASTAGPAGAAIVIAAALGCPPLLRRGLRRRRLLERDLQLPGAVERIASAVRSGAALGPALVDVAELSDGPLGEELRMVAARIRHGAGVDAALAGWSSHADASPDVVLVASALGLGAESGGQVARAIDAVAATLRERRELRGEVRALATQARSSAWVLAAAPLLFAALVASIEPGALRFLLTTPVGVGCLLAGLLLDAAGTMWMARIVREAS